MFVHVVARLLTFKYFSIRHISSETNNYERLKIVICGAGGRIGQIVSLFLKQSPHELDIALYDTSHNVSTLCKQLQLINTKNRVESFVGPMRMRFALKGADIVTILTKSKTKTFHGDSFDINIPTVSSIAKSCIEVCPDAILAVGTNPVNSIVPAINEIYKSYNISHADKIVGVTAMDSMLASITYAKVYSMDPSDVFVPVTGGSTCDTIVPLFSQASPSSNIEVGRDDAELLLTQFFEYKTQDCTSELAAAFAITRFLQSLVRAILGETDIVECAYVASPEGAPVKYMSTLVDLGENGIQNIYGPPANISRCEKKVMNSAFTNLQRDIAVGEKYAIASRKAEARLR